MARPKLSDGETVRLHMKMPEDLMSSIEDWRFENRIQSNSEAIRQLIERGLQAGLSNHFTQQEAA